MPRGRQEALDALLGKVEFVLDDRRYRVPEHPVTDWMAVVLDGQPDAVIPGLLADEDARHLYERLLDEEAPLHVGVCEQVGLWLFEEVGGRPWWEVQRALMWALDSWNVFESWCRVEARLDPLTLPLRTFCSVFVRFCVQALGEEAEAWIASFEAPPLGSAEAMEHRPEWEEEAVQGDFTDAFGSFQSLAAGGMPN